MKCTTHRLIMFLLVICLLSGIAGLGIEILVDTDLGFKIVAVSLLALFSLMLVGIATA